MKVKFQLFNFFPFFCLVVFRLMNICTEVKQFCFDHSTPALLSVRGHQCQSAQRKQLRNKKTPNPTLLIFPFYIVSYFKWQYKKQFYFQVTLLQRLLWQEAPEVCNMKFLQHGSVQHQIYGTVSLRGTSQVFYHSVVLSFSAVVSTETLKFK